MADRQELLRNALSFLSDPSTRNYPLTQRAAFLESKGLTNAEIEQVLQQVAQAPSSPATSAPVPYGSPAPYPVPPNFAIVPQIPQRDWRDYFIMAVVSGGVMFGIVSLARKYLLPHLIPPSATAYEADRDALTAQFDAAAELIKDIQSEAAASRSIVEEQREKVDSALDKLQIAINETKEGEARTKADLREIRDEVNNVRDMLPKMIEKNKDAQSQALLDLQQELKSLKSLLLSRSGSTTVGGIYPPPGSSTPTLRPSIPSWQLGPSGTTTTSPAVAPAASPAVTRSIPSAGNNASGAGAPSEAEAVIDWSNGKGKGKEVEALANSGVLVNPDDDVVA